MSVTIQQLLSAKEYPICATFFTPAEALKGAVIIASAMGVSQSYYAKFATWLSAQGYLVVTFDYSGMAASREAANTSLKNIHVNVMDWADDAAIVLAELQSRAQGQKIYWIGHSLGGQLIGLMDQSNLLSKAITIAAGSGYWLENAPQLKRRVWLMWFIAVPLSTAVLGYFPGKRLNMVGDLPLGVIQQWRRWCLHQDYAVGVEGESVCAKYAAVTVPITSYSFSDDEFMSANNIDSLHGFYTQSARDMKRIRPADVGVTRIGHFGFFRETYQDTLWHKVLHELT